MPQISTNDINCRLQRPSSPFCVAVASEPICKWGGGKMPGRGPLGCTSAVKRANSKQSTLSFRCGRTSVPKWQRRQRFASVVSVVRARLSENRAIVSTVGGSQSLLARKSDRFRYVYTDCAVRIGRRERLLRLLLTY